MPATASTQQGTIADIRDTADGTRILHVATEKPLGHLPGQYVPLSFGGLAPRPFSVASTPDHPHIEFHIRNSGSGEVSAVLPSLATGDHVMIGRPAGDCYWRRSERPLLALAGGTGVAPMKAILNAHLADPDKVPARLYWGARNTSHLYLDGLFRALSKAEPRFHYTPVLSEEDPGLPYRTGFLDEALQADYPSLDGYAIYLAGPPMMVQHIYPKLLSMGADAAFIFGDGIPPA